MKPIRQFDQFIERMIGVAGLPPAKRRELASHQIDSLVEMTPVLLSACTLVVGILLFFSAGTQVFPQILAWGFAQILLQAISLRVWLKRRKHGRKTDVSDRALPSATKRAALFGFSWSILPAIILPSAEAELQTLTLVAMTGVLCGSGFILSVIPQAVVAFSIPLTIGVVAGVIASGQTVYSITAVNLLLAFLVMMPFISYKYAQTFARHILTESAMREQKNVISLLLNEYEENASEWLWETDHQGSITHASERFFKLTKNEENRSADASWTGFLDEHCRDRSAFDDIISKMNSFEAFQNLELPIVLQGKVCWWRISGKPNFNEVGEFTGYVGIGADITAEKDTARTINQLAHKDALTGLLNRTRFNEEMDVAIGELEKAGKPFGVMFLDLDKFKLVNDTRGHLVGDELLKIVGTRINAIVGEEDYVARLGGDEFAIIMNANCNAGSAMRMATRLIQEISSPYAIDGERFKIGVSIGIALAPINGTRPSQLLRNADLALYRAKADGRGVFRFFEAQMDADEREKRMLELELKQAIEEDEFELLYQPLISPKTGRPTTIEALIRWHHPMRGVISPIEFIPIAEQSVLIQEIGCWSLLNACTAALNWPDDVSVAVNLSVQHFAASDIVSDIKSALAQSGLPANRLEIEITESLLMNNTEDVLATLRSLKALGVTIAMDDFGTGYSSLSYLMKFPFDKIKIDRSFIRASDEDKAARMILRMITQLGKSLGISIAAEGIETIEQLEFINSIDCQQFQGFLFSKPVKEGEICKLFDRDWREIFKKSDIAGRNETKAA